MFYEINNSICLRRENHNSRKTYKPVALRNLEMLVLVEREKLQKPEKNPQSQVQNQQQTQPTYDAVSEILTSATLVGSEFFDHYTIPDDGYYLYSNIVQHPICFKSLLYNNIEIMHTEKSKRLSQNGHFHALTSGVRQCCLGQTSLLFAIK